MKSKISLTVVTTVLLLIFAAVGLAETPAEPSKISVSEFVTPAGTFDLEAARQAGFEGSLNLDGFDVTLDPKSGAPMLSPAGVNSVETDPDDQYWHDMSVPDIGMNNWVFSLTVYNGDLIAGGSFTSAGGVAASYIARWDGAAWQPLGSGMDHWVFSLTVYNGDLIAGGSFTTAGGVGASYIAGWNGSAWQTLGSGMNHSVLSLTVSNTELIAGGRFTTAGGVAAIYIARWNGSAWQPLGSGMNDYVFSLTVYNGELIAGG